MFIVLISAYLIRSLACLNWGRFMVNLWLKYVDNMKQEFWLLSLSSVTVLLWKSVQISAFFLPKLFSEGNTVPEHCLKLERMQ